MSASRGMGAPIRILILDTGKEWGGGTQSLIELLRRSNDKYQFLAVFYYNYGHGNASTIQETLEALGIETLILPQRRIPFSAKLAKEVAKALLFFSRPATRMSVFLIDFLWRIQPNARRLSQLIRERQIGLVYMNNQPASNLEAIIAARVCAVPAVQHCRKVTALNSLERKWVNRDLRKMICVSEGVRNTFVAGGVLAQKCIVVHNGIDLSARPGLSAEQIRSKLGIPVDAIVIGTVGSMIPLKRVDLLIDALQGLRNYPTLRCLIVGDGPELHRLKALAQKRGVLGNCLFAGFQRDALSFINAMDIFVLSSTQEGLPRVILEAMLLSKPVVASNVTGSSELVMESETGRLFPSGDAAALTECLRELIQDDALRTRMGELGRQRVKANFSIESYVAGVHRTLDEVIATCPISF
jgi:glycosyltransferase involved in cell wall biosynthesis